MLLVQAAAVLRGPSQKHFGLKRNALSWICRDCAETVHRHSRKRFEPPSHSHDFQGIKFRDSGLARIARLPSGASFARQYQIRSCRADQQAEEGPSRFADFSIQSAPIEILDQSPAGTQGSLSNRRDSGKSGHLDQDGPRLDGVWHWGSPRRLSWRIVLQKAHLGDRQEQTMMPTIESTIFHSC